MPARPAAVRTRRTARRDAADRSFVLRTFTPTNDPFGPSRAYQAPWSRLPQTGGMKTGPARVLTLRQLTRARAWQTSISPGGEADPANGIRRVSRVRDQGGRGEHKRSLEGSWSLAVHAARAAHHPARKRDPLLDGGLFAETRGRVAARRGRRGRTGPHRVDWLVPVCLRGLFEHRPRWLEVLQSGLLEPQRQETPQRAQGRVT